MKTNFWIVVDERGREEGGFELIEVLMRWNYFKRVEIWRANIEGRRKRFVRSATWRTIGWEIGNDLFYNKCGITGALKGAS